MKKNKKKKKKKKKMMRKKKNKNKHNAECNGSHCPQTNKTSTAPSCNGNPDISVPL